MLFLSAKMKACLLYTSYQIKQDKERLEKLQKRIQREQIKYEPARNVSKTYNEIDRMGPVSYTHLDVYKRQVFLPLRRVCKQG